MKRLFLFIMVMSILTACNGEKPVAQRSQQIVQKTTVINKTVIKAAQSSAKRPGTHNHTQVIAPYYQGRQDIINETIVVARARNHHYHGNINPRQAPNLHGHVNRPRTIHGHADRGATIHSDQGPSIHGHSSTGQEPPQVVISGPGVDENMHAHPANPQSRSFDNHDLQQARTHEHATRAPSAQVPAESAANEHGHNEASTY